MNRVSQSTLDASAGSAAELIERLGMVLYVGAGTILIVVLALALWGVFGRGRPIRERWWIVGAGIVFPSVALTVLLVHSLSIGSALDGLGHSSREPMRVHVIGRQWWWEVRYELPGQQAQIVLANELHVPLDQPVELSLTTADVIHSFWVPSLAGKVDMIPGRANRIQLKALSEGVFRGQCAEFCGGPHALMALHVVAQSADDFRIWRENQARPAVSGNALFNARCAACHSVRGTDAAGDRGPDLTHIASRLSIAAGTLANTPGNMMGWLADSQHAKPGNLMPAMRLTGEELQALAAYVQSLK